MAKFRRVVVSFKSLKLNIYAQIVSRVDQWRIQRGAHGARAPPSHFLIHYLKATTLTAN